MGLGKASSYEKGCRIGRGGLRRYRACEWTLENWANRDARSQNSRSWGENVGQVFLDQSFQGQRWVWPKEKFRLARISEQNDRARYNWALGICHDPWLFWHNERPGIPIINTDAVWGGLLPSLHPSRRLWCSDPGAGHVEIRYWIEQKRFDNDCCH